MWMMGTQRWTTWCRRGREVSLPTQQLSVSTVAHHPIDTPGCDEPYHATRTCHCLLFFVDLPLIDHVYFTVEVKCLLHVLDGVVIPLDGSAGNMRRRSSLCTEHYSIPRISLVNKMDKPATGQVDLCCVDLALALLPFPQSLTCQAMLH